MTNYCVKLIRVLVCYFIYRSPKLLRYLKRSSSTQVSVLYYSNYFTALYLAANPLESFTGEYNSDEEKKNVAHGGAKEAVNENHVEQFMQVS